MKNKIINFIIISLTLTICIGCQEKDRYHIDDSAPAPAQVEITANLPRPGGAVLKYNVPDDKNLLYVKAVYEIQPGVQCETKSSYYKDSLVLEGFGDTREYDVALYSVGKNEKASEPLIVKINPDTPPIHLAKAQLVETFGGISVTIENPKKANLAITLMGDTAQCGYQHILRTFYTSAGKDKFALRGLDTVPQNFSVYFRDRWNYQSDTTKATLTPLFEELIDSKDWQEYTLPGDSEPYDVASLVSLLLHSEGQGFYSKMLPLPQIITWDFGKTLRLSRWKFSTRAGEAFKIGHPKVLEVWGSMAPNPNGSLDNTWIPLGRFECVKPSPGETITQEDRDACVAGFDYDFEQSDFASDPFVPVRYIRIRIIKTFSETSTSFVNITRVSFWGTYVK